MIHESRYSDEILPAAKYGSYATGMERISEVQVSVGYVRDETGDIHPLMPPVRTLLDTAVVNRFGVSLVEQEETAAEQLAPEVLTTTMRHFPNGLGQYTKGRSHVTVVDSYGNKNDAVFLSRDADAWLMATEAFDLFGNVKPRKSLRIPNPEEYGFHDKQTLHDRQYVYTVAVGAASDLEQAVSIHVGAGNARRVAKLAPKQDTAGTRKRLTRVTKRQRHGEPIHEVTELATSYRGLVTIGHGRWITPVGKGGRPTTQKAREEVAAAQLADILTVDRTEAGRQATRRLLTGARNFRLVTVEGIVITVRRQGQSSISIDVKRAQKRVKGQKAPTARTRCTHETYVSAAVERCLAKLD